MRYKGGALIAASAAAVLAAGCGGTGAPAVGSAASPASASGQAAAVSGGGSNRTACEVLTVGIARRALGSGAHLTIKAQPNPQMTHCQYEDATKGAVDVMVGDWSVMRLLLSPTYKPVRGFGDEAYMSGTSLVVRKGSRGMQVNGFPGGTTGVVIGSAADALTAADQAFQKKIARWLLPRL